MHAGYSDHSIDVASKGLTSPATWHDPRRRSARSGKPGREGRSSPSRSNFSSASRPNPTTWGSSNAVVRLVPCQRQDCRVAMDPKKNSLLRGFKILTSFTQLEKWYRVSKRWNFQSVSMTGNEQSEPMICHAFSCTAMLPSSNCTCFSNATLWTVRATSSV
jgi:hypothetical protein